MKKIIKIVFPIIIVGMLYVSTVLVYMHQVASVEATGENKTMIILGAKVKASEEPSLALKYRLEKAIPYLKAHPRVNVIVSGGQGADEPASEAAVMRRYLIQNGIEPKRITVEDESLSTAQNIAYAKKLLPNDTTAVTIVSNDFHVARATYIAKKNGLESDVLAAPTPQSVKYQLNIREVAALTKTWIFGI